jgi:serine/threonine-protein kinase
MDFDELQDGPRTAGKPGAFGKYYLQELVNSGGMAEIWVATDPEKQTVAVRRLHHDLRFNLISQRRFVAGCEVLSKIHNHKGVIGYIEHGRVSLTPYLVMEYVESSNLKLLLGRSDPVLAENVAQIIIDMAEALEHVHDSGFMHLDFKPENVLVTRNASLRLVDFDLAQPIPEKPKKMSRNPGTPAYMSPEQLQRREIDQRADIFALGVAAYEVLTGQKPFPGDAPHEILARQLDDQPIAPKQLNGDIPAALEKIVLKCIRRDPDNRYPNMTVVVHELQSALYV